MPFVRGTFTPYFIVYDDLHDFFASPQGQDLFKRTGWHTRCKITGREVQRKRPPPRVPKLLAVMEAKLRHPTPELLGAW